MNKVHEINGKGFEYKRKAEAVHNSTSLSYKEACAYVLINDADFTRQEAADKLDIAIGNLDGKLNRIRKKIKQAKETAELEI